jgi:hypothetical protein
MNDELEWILKGILVACVGSICLEELTKTKRSISLQVKCIIVVVWMWHTKMQMELF